MTLKNRAVIFFGYDDGVVFKCWIPLTLHVPVFDYTNNVAGVSFTKHDFDFVSSPSSGSGSAITKSMRPPVRCFFSFLMTSNSPKPSNEGSRAI